ncbi:CAIB/BAIF family enzyme [Dimargaris cristalligena]|uniref:CAIB/BAIF family enzyme n=1 Tax=Dimargaris cristalligena TaxID=215637 RepID=A0A4P9ZX03_9FUNG|nr:CAIB/BAIF family enzyme [Dimargaris cristalligena]|eukprot:RKP37230.1 CAIB/BAIF family enzyme [Dimargaris cristalligena]
MVYRPIPSPLSALVQRTRLYPSAFSRLLASTRPRPLVNNAQRPSSLLGSLWNRAVSGSTRPSVPPSSPLDGIRVLDLSRVLAGPYCTMLLGDLGADVIKVEHPLRGDDTRAWGPPFLKSTDHAATADGPGESAYFLCTNRNKRSIAIDMKAPSGRRIIHQLVAKCDVLVENYIPGKLEALGYGYDELSRINPALIYASISGYGQTGPYANRPGYDVMIEAEAGLMYITGETDGPPVKVGVAITDITTGLYAHGAIMAGLLAQQRTGQGQHLDISLIDCQLAALANIASSYLTTGTEAQRWGTSHPSIVPYRGFATADGHIIVGGGNDRQFQSLCRCLELHQLAADPRLATNQGRVAHRAFVDKTIQDRLLTQSTAHWLRVLEPSGTPFAPVNNLDQTFEHPQVKARQVVQTVAHPTAGQVPMVGPAVRYSATPAQIRRPPPRLGEHTVDVLTNVLGYQPDAIAQLVADNVVRSLDPSEGLAAGEGE